MPSFVYVLQSERNGQHYTGFSADPEAWLTKHNDGKVQATKYLSPWVLVYQEEWPDTQQQRANARTKSKR
jgi:predicted GIY-YIG superfamily endonuclease